MNSKNILTLLAITFSFLPILLQAQNVGIGTSSPDASAKLEIQATDAGILIPRVTNAQKLSISAPATGLMVYDTDQNSFSYYNGTTWTEITTGNTLDQAYDEGGAGNGSNITASDGSVRISGDGFWVTGTVASGGEQIGTPGAGTRMLFNPDQAAFRAGYVNGSQWDQSSVGNYSAAFGFNTTSSGNASIASGNGSSATGNSSSAFGNNCTATTGASFSAGNNASATNTSTIALGHSPTASGIRAVAIGYGPTASGINSVAMGWDANASASGSIALGSYSNAAGVESMAIGYRDTVEGNYSQALGSYTNSQSAYEYVIGRWNERYTPFETTLWHPNDRLFVIGNGTSGTSQSNALTVLKNGNTGIGISSPARTLHVSDIMRLEPRTSAPSSPSAGDIYYNSTSNMLQFYDGSAWRDCYTP